MVFVNEHMNGVIILIAEGSKCVARFNLSGCNTHLHVSGIFKHVCKNIYLFILIISVYFFFHIAPKLKFYFYKKESSAFKLSCHLNDIYVKRK